MTRKKVKLAYITNDSTRKATYKKRIKGLKNKMRELSTLYGIDTCAIMYNPYKSQPEVWPSPVVVQQILSKLETIPEMEKRVVHGLNFGAFSDINMLLNKKMSDIDKQIEALSRAPLNPQGVSSLSSSSMVALPSMTMVTPKAMPRTGTENIVQPDVKKMDPMQRQQWIMDLISNNNNNPQTHVGGDEIMFQFGDNINPNNGLCSDVVFPWEK
ncbi:hypothetical protein Goari_001090 [Gossypium aridum]|uniref:MADS-box domain-containing protein n=1 Tax=Gossypium aridum TaxID=34290 RepID=A0A7J8YIP9_GOSAI|nr:hypothetical protein [Gossypium aridum]